MNAPRAASELLSRVCSDMEPTPEQIRTVACFLDNVFKQGATAQRRQTQRHKGSAVITEWALPPFQLKVDAPIIKQTLPVEEK